MTRDDVLAVLARRSDTLARRDWAAFRKVYAEDARLHSPLAGSVQGRDAVVTVLFADVVHSMDIAAALGAERLREIMTALFNHSSTIVQRYGGTVDKFTGDGITRCLVHQSRWRTTLFAPALRP